MTFLNSFSVVTYLTGAAAEFVDTIRQSFTPGCPHKAHLTFLPPRPLFIPVDDAIRTCREILDDVPPFIITLGDVELFEETQVIKIGVARGRAEVIALHNRLSRGPFEFAEGYEYSPHITLLHYETFDVGSIDREKVARSLAMAQDRWAEAGCARQMVIDSVVFVQQSVNGYWVDLEKIPLGKFELQPVHARR